MIQIKRTPDLIVGLLLIALAYSQLARIPNDTRVLPIWFGIAVLTITFMGIRKMTGLRYWAYLMAALALAGSFYARELSLKRSVVSVALGLSGILMLASALRPNGVVDDARRAPVAWWIVGAVILAGIIFLV